MINNCAKDADFAALPMDLRNDNTLMISLRHHISLTGRYLSSWNTSLYGTFVDHLMDNKLKLLMPRMMDAKLTLQREVMVEDQKSPGPRGMALLLSASPYAQKKQVESIPAVF
ncbi:MAG: hypothetical protein HKN87_10845 [Saprospiraceae bacterium]|nr:hypothetical protein [Saprospiraceae bacterium]